MYLLAPEESKPKHQQNKFKYSYLIVATDVLHVHQNLFTFLLVVLEEFLLWVTPYSCCPDVWSTRSLLPLEDIDKVHCPFSAEHSSLPPTQILQNSSPLWKQNHLHLQLKPVPPCAGSTEQNVQVHWLQEAQQRSLQSRCCPFKPRFLTHPFCGLTHVVPSCKVIILRKMINLLKCT